MRYYIIINNLFDDSQFAFGEHREINYNTSDPKICKECGYPISMLEWLPPYEINVSKKSLGDFIFGTHVGFIVSKKFKNQFEQTNLKGLDSFKKVDLYYRNQLLPEEYYYPEITLLTAFVDINRISFEEKYLCNTCQKGSSILSRINGITFINPVEISDDVFFTSAIGQSTVIVSQNFKDFIEENGFTNVKLIEASKYEWDSLNPVEY
jgi:hypothetical protein